MCATKSVCFKKVSSIIFFPPRCNISNQSFYTTRFMTMISSNIISKKGILTNLYLLLWRSYHNKISSYHSRHFTFIITIIHFSSLRTLEWKSQVLHITQHASIIFYMPILCSSWPDFKITRNLHRFSLHLFEILFH